MKISVNIPVRLARDVIEYAPSRYWLENYAYRVRPDGNGLYIGAPVKGGEADPSTSTLAHEPRAYIGAKAIAEGLRIMLESPNVRHAEAAARVICGNCDGHDRDAVLQFATYSELVWG